MAVGVPIVATDCGAVRDIVDDGEQGYLVPVGDVDRFADRFAYQFAYRVAYRFPDHHADHDTGHDRPAGPDGRGGNADGGRGWYF